MRKIGLFFVLLFSFFLFKTAIMDVSAMTFDITNNTKINNSLIPDWYTIYESGRGLAFRYDDYQQYSQMSQTGYASYGYLYFCGVNLGRVSTPPTCSTGCITSSLNLVNLGGSCTITASGVTYNGNYYFLFYSVNDWAWDSLHTVPYFNDTITFYPKTAGASIVGFMTNNLTDSDYYIEYASSNRLQELQDITNQRLEDLQFSIDNQSSAINDINDSINDSSISTSSSNSFFSNFHTVDNGGISSVITAPLSFVRSMTNSCSPLSFTIFEQEISLPCGTTLFWDKEEVQPFRDVWNILIGGSFVYMLLRKVFMTIEDMKDPESDKVSVIKL